MKYDKELYIGSGFYGLDEDLQNHSEKVVKCRKEHECAHCGKIIKVGENALNEKGFLYCEPVSSYTCLECIEQWIEDSGQVEGGEQ